MPLALSPVSSPSRFCVSCRISRSCFSRSENLIKKNTSLPIDTRLRVWYNAVITHAIACAQRR
uniref:Uncharacterized protein n=1 Tax=Myoviridae sp. ctRPH1 TaxID=2826650 RepID=A0A8S5MAL3_9CAUD|nr:MAG TPA: hypothetical protein [Myoviridae sp. ctRPH1]